MFSTCSVTRIDLTGDTPIEKITITADILSEPFPPIKEEIETCMERLNQLAIQEGGWILAALGCSKIYLLKPEWTDEDGRLKAQDKKHGLDKGHFGQVYVVSSDFNRKMGMQLKDSELITFFDPQAYNKKHDEKEYISNQWYDLWKFVDKTQDILKGVYSYHHFIRQSNSYDSRKFRFGFSFRIE
jgi:hypothetical protein